MTIAVTIVWQSRRVPWLRWTVRYPDCFSTLEASQSHSALDTYRYAEPVEWWERWL